MILTTEELGSLADVTATSLDETLAADAFGKFAVLSAADTEFIQAGNDWRPDDSTQAFLNAHDSDPWILQYREGSQQFQASDRVTLEQVRHAFMSYLAGTPAWRVRFSWRGIASFDG